MTFSFFTYVPIYIPSVAETEHVLTIEAPSEECYTVQGATFDGKYFYTAFINKSEAKETAIIVKTDKSGVEIARSEELDIDHANSITILENGNLMVAHCHSIEGNYNKFSIIDKDSLEIIVTADLLNPFMAIAYCDEREQYVGGEWNGDKINFYDDDLVYSHSIEVEYIENSIPQSYYCTREAIYSLRFIFDEGFINYLYAYSYGGDTLLEYELNIPENTEAEAISVIGNDVYIICGSEGKCEIFKIDKLVA